MGRKKKAPAPSARTVAVHIRMSNLLEVNPVQGYAKIDCSVRATWTLTEKEVDHLKEQIGERFEPKNNYSEEEWRSIVLFFLCYSTVLIFY